MPIFDPNQPLSWKKADAAQLRMLQSLQGNILKGHGRPFVALLFFQLDRARQREARRFLRHLANHHVTNAHQQLLGAERFKTSGESAGPFVHVALAHAGYEALGVEPDLTPRDPQFVKGMPQSDRVQHVGDRACGKHADPFPTDLHGVILVAHDTAARCAALAGEIGECAHKADVDIVHVQHGAGLFNAEGEGIEHFGYIDGRSQPLMLAEDVEAENDKGGMSRWDAAFGPGIALVQEPGTGSYGSYLVFRKLEQDVQGFKRREHQLAEALCLKGAEHRELAGALLVGRFEDGTPVTLSNEAHGAAPPNDFDYRHDDQGARCPFHAHIRKTNDRTAAARDIQMPRRGIPYEDVKRAVHPEELPEVDTPQEFEGRVAGLLPTHGVGLLFMAYNADIARQFVAMQAGADDRDVPTWPRGPHGLDPVIGQGAPIPDDQKLFKTWDDPTSPLVRFDFAGFVKMKGGEYFFSPSLDFLREL